MTKVNFKEGVNLNEGVKIQDGVDFKRIETISAKNTPKASEWAGAYRYGKGASPARKDNIKPHMDYSPKNSSRWSVAVIFPEGAGGGIGVAGSGKSTVFNQKMDIFKAGGYSRRCIVKFGYTKLGQTFAKSGKIYKFLENNTDTQGYNKGMTEYIARKDATLAEQPIWESASEEEPVYTCENNEEPKQISIKAAIEMLKGAPIFKIIVSPEDSNVDLKKFCTLFMGNLEKKYNSKLKWCAANHYNTAHPHVHILCSRKTEDGRLLRFSHDYIKKGLKKDAESVLTLLLGPVSWERELERINKDVNSAGFCSIDRKIIALAKTNPTDPTRIPAHRLSKSDARGYLQVSKRLQVLLKKGFVEYEKYDKEDPLKKESCWVVPENFAESVRRAEFAQELEMDVGGFVLDKGRQSYKCSVIKSKRSEEDPTRVFLALIDEAGIKHLREETVDEEVDFGDPEGIFSLSEIREMMRPREGREIYD
jgi:hypothetical protein